ncbi:MAG: M14 family metallopeptidase, partial [candidate division KSB1 bacterium]|nr:M14 family metallopeptidase [candidate division KSB1 bacterium]
MSIRAQRGIPDWRRWRDEVRYLLRILPVATLLGLLIFPLFLGARRSREGEGEKRLPVRIYLSSQADRERVRRLGVEDVVRETDQYLDANVTGRQLLTLRQEGLEVAFIIEIDTAGTAVRDWPSVEDLYQRLEQIARQHPQICRMIEIGRSARWQFPIWALKISDNVALEEDEPAVLINGGIHAREPLSIAACLHVAEQLCDGYGRDPKVQQWVEELQIYIVPLLNPDGYHYIQSQRIGFPWWRKNLADNDGNGEFQREVDGVDLNRNFAFNWAAGGSDEPGSWFYRGKKPFSEPESRALRDLALQIRPVAGISYHSHGEAVLFPWANYTRPVDRKLLEHMAFQMANLLEKRRGGEPYAVMPLNGRVGQSSCWLYAALGCFDFTVEIGDEYF